MLQGHPRPWPVAKPRTLRAGTRKVQLRIGVVLVRGWYPAGSFCAGSGKPAASGTPALDKEVVHVRCAPVGNFLVVAPVLGRSAIKSQQSRRRASSLLLAPLQGTASPCYTWPLFLHTSAGVNPSGCSTPWSRAYRYPFIDI